MNFKFVENHLDELIQITITERKNNGFGVVFIDVSDNENAKVGFLGINDERFPPVIRKQIIERYEKNPDSIAYFVFKHQNSENVIEVDLQKHVNKSN